MSTLIAAYSREGKTACCDARCYDAQPGECHCICGGENHAQGKAKALANTHRSARRWMDTWLAQHAETIVLEVMGFFELENGYELEPLSEKCLVPASQRARNQP